MTDPTNPQSGQDHFWAAPAASPTEPRSDLRVERPIPPPQAPRRRIPPWLTVVPLVVILVHADPAPGRVPVTVLAGARS